MKTKLKKSVVSTETALRTLGYQYQGAYVDMLSVAEKILDRVPNILSKPSENDTDEIKAGFMLRFVEWYSKDHNKHYMVKDNKMQEVTEAEFKDDANKNKVKYFVNLDSVMKISQQKFTSLAKSDPYYYQIAKPLRKKGKDHISKGFTNLLGSIREVVAKRNGESGSKKGRNIKSIVEAVSDSIKTLKARIKTAEARGDELLTADLKRGLSVWFNDGEALLKKVSKK